MATAALIEGMGPDCDRAGARSTCNAVVAVHFGHDSVAAEALRRHIWNSGHCCAVFHVTDPVQVRTLLQAILACYGETDLPGGRAEGIRKIESEEWLAQ